MSTKNLLLVLFSLGALISCDLEKDLSIKLPESEPQLVVECYLTPGNFFQLLLSETSPYFDKPKITFINDATVTITHGGKKEKLNYNSGFDTLGGKYYNYVSTEVVPAEYDIDFTLEITDLKGRRVTGVTRLQQKVEISSVEYNYNKDSMAYILTTFPDDPSTKDFYRFTVHKDSLSNLVQEFSINDRLVEGNKIALGSGFDFKKGSKAFVNVYHIDEPYFNYLQSVDAARQANFNPFAQPSRIISNVKGGYGIFTSLVYDEKVVEVR